MSFNITKYKWVDGDMRETFVEGNCLSVDVQAGLHSEIGIELYKQDAIAIAKHFKLTSEDLKE